MSPDISDLLDGGIPTPDRDPPFLMPISPHTRFEAAVRILENFDRNTMPQFAFSSRLSEFA